MQTSLTNNELADGTSRTGEITLVPEQVDQGPRVILDTAEIMRHGPLLRLHGLESGIEITAGNLDECVTGFWEAMCHLYQAIQDGVDPPVEGREAKERYRQVFTSRFEIAIRPAVGGGKCRFRCEFWDGGFPHGGVDDSARRSGTLECDGTGD